MQKCSRNFIANYFPNASREHPLTDYENAIKALNSLQSNAEYIKNAQQERLSHPEEFSKTILQAQKYLIRSGINLETLDELPVIHVAGTKGKGTTCALCESILRQHGLRTGFYSSPHMLEVRERILFLLEKVDVAIIEVGIGGEYDSTNILRKVPIVGITSLGLDHTSILGDTIEKIAWHKAGIMKPGCQAFTVPQQSKAMKIIEDRSIELKSTLQVVEPFLSSSLLKNSNGPTDIFNMNASLAVTLAQAWLNLKTETQVNIINSEETKLGLLKCKWPGRYQIVHDINTFYLDGAHTPESIEVCVQWFKKETQKSTHKKILIFNVTGDRDSKDLLNKLRACSFEEVYFVPNKATKNDKEDNQNFNIGTDKQMARCYVHHNLWIELEHTNNTYSKAQLVKVLPSVLEAIQECNNANCSLLITGSLHLVGAALSIIDPQLKVFGNNTT
ncbi:hypothetical protein ILUMI_11950 [Ignelater luminosus]|uniref:tetrahydrofolate synthase n=1 Tax=Ignelater luminosus TaxID=2038154 RepID=A0A8K0G789_IGNLU|nr:hypothetical protein ILUMI_11950 [Ignelater luminosus]